ncbi:MAG: PD40 domain-containing protein [Prevotella sp.]|nr:PD40 domain-containing protein [Prevotella sp.]MBQ8713202.1 PD40 domain-containing protein [Prevotella sp.]
MKQIIYLLMGLLGLVSCASEAVSDAKQESAQPSIYPDYIGVTIPVNIAPLNFCMADEAALLIDAVVTDGHGHQLHSQGEESTDFDLDDWHELLGQNRGDSLSVSVSAKYDDGWHTYQPFSIYVSPDSIDYGLCYRLIAPGHEVWSKMGIYERSLSTFDERPLIENTQFEGCVNCHSFNRGNPASMSLHIRGKHGATLLTKADGSITAYNTKTPATLGLCVYPYWHPSGRYIAYSTNVTKQTFHSAHPNRIEVFDEASDLQVYDVEKNELLLSPLLKQDSVYETYPVFSADGRSLYFCAAHALPRNNHQLDSIRYNLCRIDFDPATGRYGSRIDTIVDAVALRKSVAFPRPSYDGRFLCYTLADYGQFSIWHHEADLYLLDLTTGESRPMTEANSADTESFHNWSTNSRWLVLSSRRDDGLFTRPYFCHVDASGQVTKAFMLPQRSPRRFYRDRFLSFNVPDFVTSPSPFDSRAAVRLINDEARKSFSVRP